MIKQETDRFLQCVVKLIVNNCGLYWESRFLPDTAQDILARATFFVIQTLGEDHYGLRTGFFGTANLVHDILGAGAAEQISPIEFIFVSDVGEMVDVEAADRPYDSWGSLKSPDLGTLQKGTTYTLLKADLGPCDTDPAPYIKYTTDNNLWPGLGYAAVTTYTNEYVKDPDGTIFYGYYLAPFRKGGKEVIMDPSVFKRFSYNVDKSGDVDYDHSDSLTADGQLHLKLTGSNKYTNSESSISAQLEWGHDFKFSGTGSTTAYLNIAGDANGSVYFHDGTYTGNDSSIAVHIGVWDVTHQKVVNRIDYGKSASDNGTKQNWSKELNDQISVTLEPGVTYEAYANVNGEGENTNGDYSYVIQLESLTHLSLTFVDSEY